MSELSSITIQNFRSYDEAAFEFTNGVNIIIGPNAAGKTNLLEAVYIAATGKGFRSRSDSVVIKNGQEIARIEASFGKQNRKILFDVSGGRLKKTFQTKDQKKSRLSFEDIQPVVLFQPDDLRLANGSPERRRLFIDLLLSQLNPTYASELRAYERALSQRNALLKSTHTPSSDHLFVWNVQIADRGGKIATMRQEMIKKIQSEISAIYSEVAGSKHHLDITYQTELNKSHYSDSLMKKLHEHISDDRRRGSTSFGPHRDDILFVIDEQPMKQVASRGENRTLLLALKIIEVNQLQSVRRKMPLLLLDDVFSELDGSRRRLLTSFLKDYQTLITTTDADVVGKEFAKRANILSIAS